MPSKMLHSLAMKAGVAMDDAEHKWNKAKKIASKRYKEESKAYWPVVVGITKRMLGLNEDIASPADGAPMQVLLGTYSEALGGALDARTESMQRMLETYTGALGAALDSRTENMQTVFEEYTRALDSTIANRAGTLDIGGQVLFDSGFTFSGGFGIQYTKTSEEISADNFNLASAIVAGGGIRPRFLVSLGYAF